MVDRDPGFLKIGFRCFENVYKLLRITVHEREPAALDLDHHAMTFFESMRYLIQFHGHFFNFVFHKWLRFRKAVPELAAQYLGTYHLLVTVHLYWFLTVFNSRYRRSGRPDVDYFHDKIRIRACHGNHQIGYYFAG
ncbi:hypothetical protein D3C86_1811220 [compost metagenome]